MSTNTNWILKVTQVLTWIVFIGLSIKAGTVITSYIVSVVVNPVASANLMLGLDLSQLRSHGVVEYHIMVWGIVLVTVLQATLFYKLIQVFQKINFLNPFHETIGKLILHMSLIALFTGILSKMLTGFADHYMKRGLQMPHLMEYIGMGDAYLFFAGILFVIATIFKKGIELQKENELTV